MADAVRAHLGLTSVRVSNDLNAAAYAELRLGALRGIDPGLVIGIGTGVAAAVTVGGEVMAGYHGAAGEIAYGLTDHSWPAGLEPMLETTFSGRALDELAQRLGLTGQAAALCAAAAQPGRARDELRQRVDELARQLVTCCLLLDPQRIVLVGSVAGNEVVRGAAHRAAHPRAAVPAGHRPVGLRRRTPRCSVRSRWPWRPCPRPSERRRSFPPRGSLLTNVPEAGALR